MSLSRCYINNICNCKVDTSCQQMIRIDYCDFVLGLKKGGSDDSDKHHVVITGVAGEFFMLTASSLI